ncbi:3-mercaptopyruvate sulfurtransferase [Pelagibacterium xiamenense]|uniref:3-mercaptopyruvate sulfurtransferase n=1 Tax=Pelagibacterium xiamenense TaxID=2901140 RepID=UPI001E4FABF0|nr:3-mercaptopyruvate sulfurtransferase [Pelagibacterium xiamenense]MCD7060393.1 3-mercaptopyruvate sulfurtransferase [Pelagibacterium xiamenense]
MTHFVSTQWLADHLDDDNVTIVDGTWHMPNAGRDARSEFEQSHIPGAIYFDIDAVADTSRDLPHMLPDAATFGAMAGALGISSSATMVVYDEYGLFSAPRVWWTFKAMGAREVKILDGGGPKWRDEGRPLEAGWSRAPAATFDARLAEGAVSDFAAVLEASRTGDAQILDARPAARFTGDAAEPRPGLASGHIPGSRSLPFMEVIADGHIKSEADLRALIADAGIDPQKPVITSCGSGVTAAVLNLALDMIGAPRVSLYDGAWAEWGARADAPVEKGEAR